MTLPIEDNRGGLELIAEANPPEGAALTALPEANPPEGAALQRGTSSFALPIDAVETLPEANPVEGAALGSEANPTEGAALRKGELLSPWSEPWLKEKGGNDGSRGGGGLEDW